MEKIGFSIKILYKAPVILQSLLPRETAILAVTGENNHQSFIMV